MGQRGEVAAETISVLLTKHLRTVPYRRHLAAHNSDLDPFRTTGQTSADFSIRPALSVSGK